MVDPYALEVLRISAELRDATPAVCRCGRQRSLLPGEPGVVPVLWSYAENRWICNVCFFRGR